MGLESPDIGRLLAALRLQRLDRVPNFEIIHDPAIIRHLMGWSAEEFATHWMPSPVTIDEPSWRNSWTLPPQDAIALARRVHQDAILVPTFWRLVPTFRYGSVCTREDLAAVQPPDPDQYRRLLQAYLAAAGGTGIGVGAVLSGPLTRSYMPMGPVSIQSFMTNLYDDPPFVEQVMDTYLAGQLQILEGICDLPIDFVYIDDDVAGNKGLMISKKLLERVWVPRVEKLVAAAATLNLPIMWHCCGKLDEVLPYLLRWGVSAVHPFQPACNDIYAVKRAVGDRICLVGNMNIEGVLAYGSADEVIADTREHIERLSSNGGYVVASSHSIIDSIPPENYLAMIGAVLRHGVF